FTRIYTNEPAISSIINTFRISSLALPRVSGLRRNWRCVRQWPVGRQCASPSAAFYATDDYL
ncbi:MAG: hypothetical protein KDH84_00410, partial [Calditrichaeota bacterium]|nr:hypothetical protein [Calditrichota bacterium]